jgi:hypothetical protein
MQLPVEDLRDQLRWDLLEGRLNGRGVAFGGLGVGGSHCVDLLRKYITTSFVVQSGMTSIVLLSETPLAEARSGG